MKNKFGKIGVLMGGSSSERKISLKSGKAVYQALKGQGLDVVALDIKSTNCSEQIKRAKIKVAFIALHGEFGEDGTIQSILETLRISYTGSGVMASYLCLDKIVSKRIFKQRKIPVPEYDTLHRESQKLSFERSKLKSPLVVKPSTEGSSIGVSFVRRESQLKPAINLAFRYDDAIIIERYLEGREITVAILNERPLPIVEILPKKKFFDFQAKYTKGKSEYLVPAKMSQKDYARSQALGLLAHQTLGCRGFSRVDMILTETGPVVLEVNSIPGLTATSLLPLAASAVGLSFGELCVEIVKLALR